MEMYKDICDINQCPVDCRMNGLMLALKEPALSEFRNHRNDEGMTFDGMIEHFRICYEGMDFKRSELQAWNAISYKTIKDQNPTKPPSECVVLLVDSLNEKRRGLDASQKTDDAMHKSLTNACWGIPEFQSALSAPFPHLSTFINQLKMAVSNYHALKNDPTSATYISDNYHDNDCNDSEVNFTGLGQRGVSSRSSPGNSRNRNEDKKDLYNFNNRCYVCGKEDCRAWKHDKDSRLDARKRWKSRSNAYITASLDVQDVQEDDDKTDLYIAEAFEVLDFDDEA